MAAITGTLAPNNMLLGKAAGTKQITVTATLTSASDTITLTKATHGIRAITGIVGAAITGGADANFCILQVSGVGGLVLTVVSLGADGAAATDWTGATISITVVGTV